MNRRVLKIMGWVAALLLVLGVGAVVGGGIVYATTQDSESISFSFRPNGEELFDPEPGIVIAVVLPDGPAAEAGVVRGDILLQVDGEAVDDVVELMRVLEGHEVGDEVELTVLHGDDERTLTATLGDRDDVAYLGVVPCASIPIPERRLTIRTAGSGATIIDVVADSPADQAGLQEGDVIIAVDGQELTWENNLADVIAAYEPGDTVTLEVERPDLELEKESQEVTVELGEHPDKEGVAYLGVKYRPARRIRVLEGEGLPFDWQHIRPFSHREGKFSFHVVPGGELDDEIPFLPGELSLHIAPHIEGELEGEIKQGAIIRRVDEDSPAEAAGLREGDLITAIGGDPVEGPQDLVEAIAERQPGDQVTLTISQLDEDEEREVEVTLVEHPEEEGKAYLGVRIGGFIHIHRSKDGEEYETELDLDLDVPFDDLPFEFDDIPFEFDDMPYDFEFHFPPEPFNGGEVNCCGRSI